MSRGNAVTIRRAVSTDVPIIARLSDQLGYPTSSGEAERRLGILQRDKHHAVFIAELEGAGIIGWVHVFENRRLESDPFAEIGGLIVEETRRGSGAGRDLIQTAENWAREKGYRLLRIRTNVIREDAHAFYEKMGYRRLKTQSVYGRELEKKEEE